MRVWVTSFWPAIRRLPGSIVAGAGNPTLAAFTAFCAALLFHVAEVSQGIGNTLEGPHEFRQAQTAISTYYLEKDGAKIDYETPVLGSPASLPFEFPTYQLAVMGVHRLLGCRLDLAGRITSIAIFYLTLPLIVWTLGHLQLPRAGIWLGLATLLVSPVYIFYTRAFLIESTALFTSWVFLFALTAALCRVPPDRASAPRPRFRAVVLLILALLAGILAAVTKITTFAVHAAGAILFWLIWHRERLMRPWADANNRRFLRNSGLRLGGVFAIILVFAVGWTRYTDVVKLRNPSPIARRLTSSALMDWNFSYPGELTRLSTWRGLYDHFLTTSAGSFFPVGIVLIFFALIRQSRAAILACLAAFLAGPGLFTNLYFIHDYYWYANTIFFSLACGIALGTFLFEERGRLRPVNLLAIVLVYVGAQAAAYHYSGYHLVQRVPPHEADRIVATLKEQTPPEAGIVIFGFDWSPLIPYYAERRAFMVPWSNDLFFAPGSQQAIRNLAAAGHPIAAVVFGGATAREDVLQRKVLACLPGRFTREFRPDGALVVVRVPSGAPIQPHLSR